MASPISCLSILVIHLLVTSLFYHVSSADEALVESIFQYTDYDFCLSSLLSNPWSTTASLYRQGLISTILNLNIIEDGRGEIKNLLLRLTNPLDRTRLSTCWTDIDDVLKKTHNIIWKRQIYSRLHHGKLHNALMNMRAPQNVNHQYQISLTKWGG